MEEKKSFVSGIDFERYKTITLNTIFDQVQKLSENNPLIPFVHLGYPNLDVEANIKDDEIIKRNPGVNPRDYYGVEGDSLLLKENMNIWMSSKRGEGYQYALKFPNGKAN